jgi:hypothetical protein
MVPREQGAIQLAKKKTVDAPATEPAQEVTMTGHEVAIEPAPATEATEPASKPKKAKKPKAPDITLEDLAAKYLQHLEDTGKSNGTLFSYKLELVTALDEIGRETKLADLTPTRVLEFFVSDRVMKTRTGVAKARPTFLKTQRVLRLALQWAQDAGLVESAPVPEQAATF